MGFVLIGIGGIDLVDGNKKLTLAYVWQLVRFHTLLLLDGWTEQKLLEWALGKVKKDPKPANFKEKSWATGQFLFNLLYAIEPRAIN